MNAEEYELLKEQLKLDILEEINSKPFKKSSRALQEIREKYINNKNGLLTNLCGVPQNYQLWDVIRKLTTMMLGKNRIDELEQEEVEQAKKIADALCDFAVRVKSQEL